VDNGDWVFDAEKTKLISGRFDRQTGSYHDMEADDVLGLLTTEK
jgi:hypothetical protein